MHLYTYTHVHVIKLPENSDTFRRIREANHVRTEKKEYLCRYTYIYTYITYAYTYITDIHIRIHTYMYIFLLYIHMCIYS